MTLVTDHISEISKEGVRTSDGTLHAADTILFATGFDLEKSLQAYQQIGLSGKREELQPRAYFGITHPEYPNFFALLGRIIPWQADYDN